MRFERMRDPKKAMKIGIINRREFSSYVKFVDWLIAVMPTILGVEEIPEDILLDPGNFIKEKYYNKVNKFLDSIEHEIKIEGRTLDEHYITWPESVSAVLLYKYKFPFSEDKGYTYLNNVYKSYKENKRREKTNESLSFERGRDPKKAMDIGLINKRNFKSKAEFISWLIDIYPIISGEEIPKDVLLHKQVIKSSVFNNIINFITYDLTYPIKIGEETYTDIYISKAELITGTNLLLILKKELKRRDYPEKTSESVSFERGRDPKKAMDIGLINKRKFSNKAEYIDWIIAIIPIILGTDTIPEDILLDESTSRWINNDYFKIIHRNFLMKIEEEIEIPGVPSFFAIDWFIPFAGILHYEYGYPIGEKYPGIKQQIKEEYLKYKA